MLSSGLLLSCKVNKQVADSHQQAIYYQLMQDQPIQEITQDIPLTIKNYTITPVYQYKIGARVLSTERYYFDKGAEIAPVDFALGWGKMSDSDLVRKANISISQGGRFYHWYASSFDLLSIAQIETQSANVHLIPINDTVKSRLLNVSQGDYIYIEGDLVNVKAPDGATMNSSVSREDVEAGACEIILVKELIHIL